MTANMKIVLNLRKASDGSWIYTTSKGRVSAFIPEFSPIINKLMRKTFGYYRKEVKLTMSTSTISDAQNKLTCVKKFKSPLTGKYLDSDNTTCWLFCDQLDLFGHVPRVLWLKVESK